MRIFGALVINGFADWPHFIHFLFHSLLVPTLSLYAIATYLVVGIPIYIWARRRDRITLRLFVVVGAIVGFFSSHPMLLVPQWAAAYIISGVVAGAVGYATLRLLEQRFDNKPSDPPVVIL